MKLFGLIALAACALVLSAASSPAKGAQAKQATAASFNCISACADYESTVNQFFTDVAAASAANVTTNVYSVLPQYSVAGSEVQYNVAFDPAANSSVDESPYPAGVKCHDGFDKYCLTDSQLQSEIGKVIAAKGWPTHTTTALYFIFTPANVGVCQTPGKAINGAACTTNVFCAYHHYSGQKFIYVVEPDDAAVYEDGCDTGEAPAGNSADPTLSTISHEQIEAITDPFGNGWYSEDPETFMGQPDAFFGSEIGDLCAWNFGTELGQHLDGALYNQTINGHDYYLQQEYSNADAGCVQYAGGTPTNFTPQDPLYSGVGPLVYHAGGPVMTSNTVYTIYWVPTAPVNNHPPKIAGLAKVGRKLRALNGAWANPLTFKYQWLRCSGLGASCRQIRRATSTAYTLVHADAGHRIEVRVTATNQAGRATATSAPTAKVKA